MCWICTDYIWEDIGLTHPQVNWMVSALSSLMGWYRYQLGGLVTAMLIGMRRMFTGAGLATSCCHGWVSDGDAGCP